MYLYCILNKLKKNHLNYYLKTKFSIQLYTQLELIVSWLPLNMRHELIVKTDDDCYNMLTSVKVKIMDDDYDGCKKCMSEGDVVVWL